MYINTYLAALRDNTKSCIEESTLQNESQNISPRDYVQCITYVTTFMRAFPRAFFSPVRNGMQERLKKQVRYLPPSASRELYLAATC